MLVARVWLLIIHLQTGMQSPNVIFLCLPSLDLVHRESQCFFWPIPPGALYYTTKGYRVYKPLIIVQPSSISTQYVFLFSPTHKQIYRLHNVCTGYVLYRALVVINPRRMCEG